MPIPGNAVKRFRSEVLFVGIVQFTKYQTIFRVPSFRAFWLGFTVSALGDAMTNVALIWYVYQTTHAPQAVGLLLLCYTGPVLLGGLLAGFLLDRLNRRTVMLVDATFRGSVVALIPLLAALGHLALWQFYAVAAVYGLLYMIPLAGAPSLIPVFSTIRLMTHLSSNVTDMLPRASSWRTQVPNLCLSRMRVIRSKVEHGCQVGRNESSKRVVLTVLPRIK